MYSNLILEVKNGVAHMTLNRPEAANGINLELAEDLDHAARKCDDDPAVRAILITRRGKVFLRGGDLKSFAAKSETDLPRYLEEVTSHLHRAVSLIRADALASSRRGSWQRGRRRIQPRLRGRFRDRDRVGEVHDGLHQGGPNARRFLNVLSSAHRRAAPRDGTRDSQSDSFREAGARSGHRHAYGSRCRAHRNRDRIRRGTRDRTDAGVSRGEAATDRQRGGGPRRADGPRDRNDLRDRMDQGCARRNRGIRGKAPP